MNRAEIPGIFPKKDTVSYKIFFMNYDKNSKFLLDISVEIPKATNLTPHKGV